MKEQNQTKGAPATPMESSLEKPAGAIPEGIAELWLLEGCRALLGHLSCIMHPCDESDYLVPKPTTVNLKQ